MLLLDMPATCLKNTRNVCRYFWQFRSDELAETVYSSVAFVHAVPRFVHEKIACVHLPMPWKYWQAARAPRRRSAHINKCQPCNHIANLFAMLSLYFISTFASCDFTDPSLTLRPNKRRARAPRLLLISSFFRSAPTKTLAQGP